MEYYSVDYWQENFDELFERLENGESIGIINQNGENCVMIPYDDEVIKLYTELNNEAQ